MNRRTPRAGRRAGSVGRSEEFVFDVGGCFCTGGELQLASTFAPCILICRETQLSSRAHVSLTDLLSKQKLPLIV